MVQPVAFPARRPENLGVFDVPLPERKSEPVDLKTQADQRPGNVPLPERQPKTRPADPQAAHTQQMVGRAHQADRSLLETEAVLGRDTNQTGTSTAVLDAHKDYSNMAWKDVESAVNAELRMSTAGADLNALEARKTKMLEYAPQDQRYRQIVQNSAVDQEMGQRLQGLSDPQKLQTLSQRLDGASPELSTAIYNNSQVKNLLEGSVTAAYDKGGSVEAAKRIRELTDGASPAVAAHILSQAQPTIGKFAKELDVTGAHDPVATDLSAATHKASQSPDGQPVVDQTARTLLQNLGQDLIRFGPAMAPAVASGTGMPLAKSMLTQLRAAGDAPRASYVARGVSDGINQSADRMAEAGRKFQKAREEMVFLSGNYMPLENPADPAQTARLTQFWDQYGKDHPELGTTKQAVDAEAMRYLQLADDVSQNKKLFEGLAPDVIGTNNEVAKDKAVLDVLGASKDAHQWLGNRIMNQQSGDHPVIAQLSPWNLAREVRTVYTRTLNMEVGKAITTYRAALEKGDYQAAKTAVESLRTGADRFGLSTQRKAAVDRMFESVQEMIDAKTDPVNGAARTQAALEKFKLGETDPERGPTLNASTLKGMALRGLGVALVAPILKDQLVYQWNHLTDRENSFGAIAQTGLNTMTTVHQARFMWLGAKEMTGKFPGAAAQIEKWAHYLDFLAFSSAATEGLLAFGYARGENPDYWMSGLHGAASLSNMSVATAYAKSGTSVFKPYVNWVPVSFGNLLRWGTIGGAASSVAIYGYGQYQKSVEAKKFETETTSRYLQALGLNKAQADGLRDQDGEGRSPLPTLYKTFEGLGLDMKNADHQRELVNYMNGLGADQVNQLVSRVHRMQPDDAGNLPQHDRVTDPYLMLPRDPQAFASSPAGQKLAPGIQFNEASQQWEDSATRMRWDPGMKRWVEQYPLKDASAMPKVYDPDTMTLRINGHQSAPLRIHTLDGLRNWMVQQGYDPPVH